MSVLEMKFKFYYILCTINLVQSNKLCYVPAESQMHHASVNVVLITSGVRVLTLNTVVTTKFKDIMTSNVLNRQEICFCLA